MESDTALVQLTRVFIRPRPRISTGQFLEIHTCAGSAMDQNSEIFLRMVSHDNKGIGIDRMEALFAPSQGDATSSHAPQETQMIEDLRIPLGGVPDHSPSTSGVVRSAHSHFVTVVEHRRTLAGVHDVVGDQFGVDIEPMASDEALRIVATQKVERRQKFMLMK